MKGKYIYGVIKKPKNTSEVARSEAKGLLGRWRKKDGLSTIDFRSLSAVVAETERKDYRKLSKEETVRELISHQQTIEKIMSESPILPVKFGTILKNEEEVKSVLEKGYFFLRNTLRKIEDKIELDLVCFWNEQKAAQMASRESQEVQNWQKRIAKKGKPTLEDKIALGKLVAQYLATKKEKLSSQILRMLKKEAVKNCPHALADVNMVLNQAFLVQKENEERFNHALNIVDSQLADLVKFRLVGPLPPYSFATVVIKSLDEGEVKKAKKLLGLDGQLNLPKIKKAYDQLAFKFHPDHGGNPVEFERVTKSYQLLRKFAEQGLVGVYLYKWEES